MVSIKDISIACGVSVATVSKALNNHKDVGEDTKEKIRKKAREMGYVPNFASKALKTNRTYNIGVVFADEAGSGLMHDHFARVLNSLKNELEIRGYDITFVNRNGNVSAWNNRMTYLEHCKYRRFDGAVILCTDFHDPEILELVESDIPVITFDHMFNDRSAVVSDAVKGISDLVHYAYDMGHRKIAYIHGLDSAVTRNRVSSFYKTCQDLGIEVPPEYVKEAPYRDTTATYCRTVELLQLENRPTCILFPDDFAYIGGFNAITLAGLKVPDDISTMGYDGIEIGKYLEPALTTLVQDTDQMGKELARKLINTIEEPKTSLVEHILVDGKVYPGRSVKKLV